MKMKRIVALLFVMVSIFPWLSLRRRLILRCMSIVMLVRQSVCALQRVPRVLF